MKKMLERNDSGFTLMELLVVIVVIGILAGIAIPSYIGAQRRAHFTALKSDLRSMMMIAHGHNAGTDKIAKHYYKVQQDGETANHVRTQFRSEEVEQVEAQPLSYEWADVSYTYISKLGILCAAIGSDKYSDEVEYWHIIGWDRADALPEIKPGKGCAR